MFAKSPFGYPPSAFSTFFFCGLPCTSVSFCFHFYPSIIFLDSAGLPTFPVFAYSPIRVFKPP